MSSPSYRVGPFKEGSTVLYHHDNPIATIEQYQHYPETVKDIFGRHKPNNGKFLTRYKVTEMGGFPEEDFRSMKGAVQAAAAFHRNNARLTDVHPMVAVANHLNAVGHSIHAAAADHRMTQEDQEKLLDISKAHANMRNLVHTHFSDHVNNP